MEQDYDVRQEVVVGRELPLNVTGIVMPDGGTVTYQRRDGVGVRTDNFLPGAVVRAPILKVIKADAKVFGLFAPVRRSVPRDMGGGGSQGAQGARGYQGYQGSQGYQGHTGPIGHDGDPGPQGNTGPQGNQGFQGQTGSGAQGSQGHQGSQGSVGAQGNQGFQGQTGSGAQGSQGHQGSQGSQGSTGGTGSQGAQGATGTTGSQGGQGFQGSTGPQGNQGFQGATGTGAQGAQGHQGPADGAQGSQGFQGAQGANAVNTGKTLFVDSVNGNDGTGTRGRMDLPFLTCAAAKTAASSGDVIEVRPGSYNEANLAKDGVHWFGWPGANIAYTGTSNAIFDDGGAAVSCRIVWHGTLSASGTKPIIKVTHSSSSYVLDVAVMTHTGTAGSNAHSCIYQSAGSIVGRVQQASAIRSVLSWNSGNMTLEMGNISGSGSTSVLDMVAADDTHKCSVQFKTLTYTSTGYAIAISDGQIVIRGERMDHGSSASGPVYYYIADEEVSLEPYTVIDIGTIYGGGSVYYTGRGYNVLAFDRYERTDDGTLIYIEDDKIGRLVLRRGIMISNEDDDTYPIHVRSDCLSLDGVKIAADAAATYAIYGYDPDDVTDPLEVEILSPSLATKPALNVSFNGNTAGLIFVNALEKPI